MKLVKLNSGVPLSLLNIGRRLIVETEVIPLYFNYCSKFYRAADP